jgi:two-component system, LuxR family, response regulator FixJ
LLKQIDAHHIRRRSSSFPASEAGRELGISPRTIEVHRARIMEKLGAKNAADLMRVVLGKGRGQRAKATVGRH